MKETIHVLVRVDTQSSDIYDHNALCEEVREYLKNKFDSFNSGHVRNEDERKFINIIDRVEVL